VAPANSIRVALSTASAWPEPIAVAFQLAAELGYDGVEVMVWGDAVSQDIAAVAALADRYRMPVLALHSPCLLISQRLWAPDPLVRLQRSVQAATELGAGIVVVHPPFRWQQDYATGFGQQVAALEAASGLAIAVENMFPVRRGGLEVSSCLGLVKRGFTGTVVLEVSTRRARTRQARRALLTRALLFARLNL
jgi:sugar phosphate isomerase/epimerase